MALGNSFISKGKKLRKILSYFDKAEKIKASFADQILDNAPMEFAIMDLQGHYLYANELYIPDAELRKKIIGNDDKFLFSKIGISAECIEERMNHFQEVVKEKKPARFIEKLLFFSSIFLKLLSLISKNG